MLRALNRLLGDGAAGRARPAPRGAFWQRLTPAAGSIRHDGNSLTRAPAVAAMARSGGLSQPEPSVKMPCARPSCYCTQIYGPHRKFTLDTQSPRLYVEAKRDQPNGVACLVFPREVGRVAQLVEQVTFNHDFASFLR